MATKRLALVSLASAFVQFIVFIFGMTAVIGLATAGEVTEGKHCADL